ncbi:MAG: glycosyltransferase family 4 protein [Actinomycetota bacterium]
MVRHLAFHYLGCAAALDDGVAVPSRVGPLLECLAAMVDRLTVIAYDLPADPVPVEDGIEYVVRSPRRNVDVLSLGQKGTLRTYISRRRRVRRIVEGASPEWDALVLQLANRRANLVFAASRSDRIAAMIVGRSATHVARAPWPLRRKLVGRLRTSVEERHVRRIVRGADVVVTNSEELSRQYGRESRIDVIPMSTRAARYEHRADDRMIDTLDLMISGRIAAEKGVFEAMTAFASVHSDFPRARLHLVGDGPALAQLLDRAQELGVSGDVVAHGWVPATKKLFDIYASMDVLLLPSYAEGLPYSVWEALAHSVLVICTPVDGVRDAFGDEEEVMFVPPRDDAAIARAIRRLAGDAVLRRRLLRAGYDRARNVTAESVASRLVQEIASTRGPEWEPSNGPGSEAHRRRRR